MKNLKNPNYSYFEYMIFQKLIILIVCFFFLAKPIPNGYFNIITNNATIIIKKRKKRNRLYLSFNYTMINKFVSHILMWYLIPKITP